MESSKLNTSLLNSSLLSTSNNILSSSLSTGILENKLLKPNHSRNLGRSVKRQIPDIQELSSKKVFSERNCNSLLETYGSLSVNNSLSSSFASPSSTVGLSTSSVISSNSSRTAAKSIAASCNTIKLTSKEETKNVESLSNSSFPEYPALAVDGEILKPKAKSFCSDSKHKHSLGALESKKEKVLQFVCIAAGGLVAELKKGESPTRKLLDEMIADITKHDPEFVLKLALYCRKELNLRLISNLLLAIASSCKGTSFYLKKYFSAAVLLPSDWIMIANLFLTVNKTLPTGSLPAALRRVMKEKFPDFDEHQLAKYNKSLKGPSMDGVEMEDREEIMRGRDYDLKRLVRLLHIKDPADIVLAILEKKYPEDKEKFRQSRLDGMFDPSRAGKRMKLKTPITWETQISLHGNKPEVWAKLIDEKKLPYMATVRNIRNLLLSGISEAHVKKVCSYISNQTAVARSRMFPFQFFTAYDILSEVRQIKEEADGGGKKRQARKRPAAGGDQKEEKEKWMIAKEKKRNELIKGINLKHIDSIKLALDEAVNISARKNIPPLKGTTLILCGYSNDMNRRFTEAKGVSQKGATVRDVTALFSLMCQQACEDSQLVFFSANHMELTLPGNEILSKVEFVKTHSELNKKVGVLNSYRGAPTVLKDYLENEKFVDNLIIFQDQDNNYSQLYDLVKKYRKYVNKNLLLAMVNICGRPADSSEFDELFTHQNDLNIRGFSDSVFNMIVNKGNGGQLEAVENIDKKYNLINLRNPLLQTFLGSEEASPGLEIPVWQHVRVFVSSTFLDMEAERNILHQFVLPQLQRKAAQRYINVDFIDLRWGLDPEQLRTNNEVELCLDQIKTCDLFIGILGERYGWVPDTSVLDNVSEEYRPVLQNSVGRSITEIEMRFGVLNCPDDVRDRSFFYFRAPDVSAELGPSFECEERDDIVKLDQLKRTIRDSGVEVKSYSCSVQNGRITGLEEFGSGVLNNLCNALDNLYPCVSITESGKFEEELKRQKAACSRTAGEFSGRTKLLETVLQEVASKSTGVISLRGQAGSGMTSVLATAAARLANTKGLLIIPFISHTEEQVDTNYVLKYVIHHLGGKATDENSIKSLSVLLQRSLERFSLTSRRVVIFLDSLEKSSQDDLCWFPQHIPENCLFVVKALQGSKLSVLLKKQKDNQDILVNKLDVQERNEICREVLKRRGKSLGETAFNNQLLSLVGKRGAGSPGYLRQALNQISKQANFANLREEISKLGSTIAEINNDILLDCEQIFGFDFVKLVMVFLHESVVGLTKTQITTVCSFYHHFLNKNLKPNNLEKLVEEFNVFRTTNSNYVSLIDVSMCMERLEPCLQNTEETLQILENISSVVHDRYIKKFKSSLLMEINAILATVHIDNYMKEVLTPSGVSSLTHHIGVCGDVRLLKTIVCSPKFIQVKSSLGQGSQLYKEYLGKSLKFKSAQEKFSKDPLVREYQAFVKNNLETIKQQPNLISQVILNEPEDSVIKNSVSSQNIAITTLRWNNGPKTVKAAGFGGQTIISNASNPTTFILPLDKIVLTGYSDGSLLVSSAESLEEMFCLVGHSQSITGLGELDKTVLVSASSDGLLSTWDMERRIRLNSVKAHDRRLSSLAVRSPNILTASWDGSVKVWSKSLVNISTISTKSPLNCLLLHPTKLSVITGGWDANIRIWDLETLKQKAVIRGHDSSVQSIRLSSDCRKIISGSLNGTVKLWDSSTGVEVATFPTRQGLSHLDIDGGTILVAHTDGLVTCWPLALGRALLTVTSREMLCPMFSQLTAGLVPLVEATSLAREITALHEVSQSFLMVGFSNGDIQMNETKEDKWRGWKVFESKIDFIGSEQGLSLYIEGDIDEDENMSEGSTIGDFWDDDLNLTLPNIDLSLFDCPASKSPVRGEVFTAWLVSGPHVVLATFHGSDLMATFRLADIRSDVVEVKVLNKDIIIVFSQSGIAYTYYGSDCGQAAHNTLKPANRFDTLHGVLSAVTFSDSDIFASVGSDGKARLWSLSSEGNTLGARQLSESSSFSSKPVGVALTKQRQKDFLIVGFEDGTLALVEMKKNFENFGKPMVVPGNGHGLRSLTVTDERLLMVHSDGLVSLWSLSGSEISQYSRGSTAALLCLSQDRRLLLLARTDLQVVCPTEPECEDVFSGHQGAVTALAASPQPGLLLSAGQDGRVNRWERGRQPSSGGTDRIVSVLALPAVLSLSKSGKLSHWTWEDRRLERRDSLQLEGESFEKMAATNYKGNLMLTTVSGVDHIKIWQIDITPATFQATCRAELKLGQKILRLDTKIDPDDGKLSIVAAMESTAVVLSYLEVKSTQKYRIVHKKTLSLTTYLDEILFIGGEYLHFIEQEGPLKLFKNKFVLRHPSGEAMTYITAQEDGSIDVSSDGHEVKYEVHGQQVTDIKITSHTQLVTVSLDGKVKVWRWDWWDSHNIQQTGEFTGLGPGLTCLDVDQQDNLVVGDSAGNVLCLSVIQATQSPLQSR